MAAVKRGITRCGLCRFYSHEGRRGGLCSQLNVTVGSGWTACALAGSPFVASDTASEKLAGIADWHVLSAEDKAVAQAAPARPIASKSVISSKPMVTSKSVATSLSSVST
ncbi:MAG: hypothetical protein AAFV85_20615 [Cyanobacteria bacterium J06634_6]